MYFLRVEKLILFFASCEYLHTFVAHTYYAGTTSSRLPRTSSTPPQLIIPGIEQRTPAHDSMIQNETTTTEQHYQLLVVR